MPKEENNPLLVLKFSHSLDSVYRNYIKQVKPVIHRPIGFGLSVAAISDDSCSYYFYAYPDFNIITSYNVFVGMTYIDSTPVVITMRKNDLFGNADSINERCVSYLSEKIPLKETTGIIDIINCYCVCRKDSVIKTKTGMYSNLVPRKKDTIFTGPE